MSQGLPDHELRMGSCHGLTLTDIGKAQGLAQTVWSYGKLCVPAPQLTLAAVSAAAAPDSGWKIRDYVDLMWGCARLGQVEPHSAFTALGRDICAALQSGGPLHTLFHVSICLQPSASHTRP